METVGELLDNSCREHGPRVALKMRSGLRLEKFTFQELWEQTQRMTRLLEDRGMGKGDRVLLWAPNCPYWVITYLGILLRGGVVVPVDVRSTRDFATKVATQTEPVLAVVSESILESTRELPVPLMLVNNLPRLLYQARRVSRQPPIEGGDLAVIMYTSGTTGEPKGVMLTHRNLTSNLEMTMQLMPLAPGSRVLSLPPLEPHVRTDRGAADSLAKRSVHCLCPQPPAPDGAARPAQ